MAISGRLTLRDTRASIVRRGGNWFQGNTTFGISFLDAGTNTRPTVVRLDRNTSGTPAADIGQRFLQRIQTSTTKSVDAFAITTAWRTIAHASREATVELAAADATQGGVRNYLVLNAAGYNQRTLALPAGAGAVAIGAGSTALLGAIGTAVTLQIEGTAPGATATLGGRVGIEGGAAGGAGVLLQSSNAAKGAYVSRIEIPGGAGSVVVGLRDMKLNYGSGYPTQTTIGVAGAASALPANPDGYIRVQVGAVEKAIPYYAQA